MMVSVGSLIGLCDFSAIPPELTSSLIYSGAGSAPLRSAATAWSELSHELSTTAHACQDVLTELVALGWQGPSSAKMGQALTPYITWLHQTANQLYHVATQALAAVDAYEKTFSAVVPPQVVFENRARTAALIATNILGQNSPAIAAHEAAYGQMWSQDALAMHHYVARSASATVLTPVSNPPHVSKDTGGFAQQVAASQAGLAAAHQGTETLSSWFSNWMNQLGLNIFSANSANNPNGLDGILGMIDGIPKPTPFSNMLNLTYLNSLIAGAPYSPPFIVGCVGDMTALMTVIGRTLQEGVQAGLPLFGAAASVSSHVSPELGTLGELAATGTLASHVHPTTAVNARIGQAHLIKSLTVPSTWTAMTDEIGLEGPAAEPIPIRAGVVTANPIVTAGIPAALPSLASRMVDKADDDQPEEGPVYGSPTKALIRTPIGG